MWSVSWHHCRMVMSAIISLTSVVTQLLMLSSLHYTNMAQRGIWCCPHLIHHYVQCKVLITSLVTKWLSLQVTIEAATNPSLLLDRGQVTKISVSYWHKESFCIWRSSFFKVTKLCCKYCITGKFLNCKVGLGIKNVVKQGNVFITKYSSREVAYILVDN